MSCLSDGLKTDISWLLIKAHLGFPRSKYLGNGEADEVDTTCSGYWAPRVAEPRAVTTIRDDNGNELKVDLRRFCARCGHEAQHHEREQDATLREEKAAARRVEAARARLEGASLSGGGQLAAAPPSLAEVHAMGARELKELLTAAGGRTAGITDRQVSMVSRSHIRCDCVRPQMLKSH